VRWNVVLLATLTSPQFLGLVVLGAWMLYLTATPGTSMTPMVQIRTGSHVATMARSVRKGIAAIGVALIAVTLGTGVTSVLTYGQQPAGVTDGGAAGFLASLGIPPLVGVMLAVGLVVLALVALQALFIAVRLASGGAIAERLIALAVFLWGAASAAGFVAFGSLTDASSYLDVVIQLQHPATGIGAIAVMVLVATGGFLVAHRADRIVRFCQVDVAAPLPVLVLITDVVVWGSMIANGSGRRAILPTTQDVLAGSGGTILALLLSVMIFAGYAFVAQLRARDALVGWDSLLLIRHGHVHKWVWHEVRAETARAVAFMGALLLSLPVVYFLSGGTHLLSQSQDLEKFLYLLVVNGSLQLVLYSTVSAGAVIIGSGTTGLAVVGVIVIAQGLPIGSSPWIPVQATASERLLGGWIPLFTTTAGLIVATGLALIALICILRHRYRRA
jgi:hypothetical protein